MSIEVITIVSTYKRKKIRPETISAVASENAGHPLDDDRAAGYAEALEPILEAIETLRSLPLKNSEPATIFRPVESSSDD